MKTFDSMRWTKWCLALLVSIAACSADMARAADDEDAALKRTRKMVRMLDDIYKTTVVLITEHYIEEDSNLPAGTAAKALFAVIKQKGWHDVQLLDASGEPYDDINSPDDEFEIKAVAKLLGGESYYDEVIEKDGKRFLRAATPVPVVMKKCIMCHSNYEDVPEGQPIGALSYTLPIE